MSYGPDAWRSGKTITYKGEQIPELSEAALQELWGLAGGNYTNYARQYLGSTLPIGFVKDQGMEYQCTSEGGKEGAAKVSNAIALGVLKHVSPEIKENLYYTMVPTALPTTKEQDEVMKDFGALADGGLYSKTSKKYCVYIEIIQNGFGSGVALNNTYVTTMPATAKDLVDYHNAATTGGEDYLEFRTSAWNSLVKYYNENIKK